jgi:hypothetical protein
VNGREKPGILKGVLYILDLKRNLFSIKQATETGLAFISTKNRCKLRAEEGKGKVMMEGYKTGKLYSLRITPIGIQSLQANVVHMNVRAPPKLLLRIWHNRMAHVNEETIKKMYENNCLDHFEVSQDKTQGLCSGCMYGKQYKNSYPVNPDKIRSQVPGEFVHGDVVGPMKELFIGGARYFLLFKDDCTGYHYVYFLKQKSEVLKCFQNFVLSLRRDTGNMLTKFRSDRGGELCSKAFDEYLLQQSIVRETSAPYTSEQNGYIKRDNRIVTEAA